MVFLKYFNEAVTSFILLLPLVAGTQNVSNSLPTVDLGYEVYRAADFNQTAGYYNFSNIRYAAPPLGNLRFRKPEPALTDRSVVNDGNTNRICPQGSANWGIVGTFLLDYIATGKLPNISTSAINDVINSDTVTNVTRDPRESEDCLFLDVIVPQGVFENAGSGHRGAPVLVWIHGGGYTSGSKTGYGSPAGLLKRSPDDNSAIYVSMNYRLGAFGFLSGPSLQEDGTANAGLYDQRLALQWVQDHIHLFGGDKDRVTIFGESAGGGSVIHQITAFGGREEAPTLFQQAIPQSAGWFPIGSPRDQERVFQDFLAEVNASSLADARNAEEEVLIVANARQVARSVYGQFTYGPAIDGDFVPLDAKALLAQGRFAEEVRVLAGHNADEGLLFAPPVTNDEDFVAFVREAFPSAAPDVVDYITGTLYPPVGDGTLYENDIERAALLSSEAFFTCADYALNRASENDSYRYLFAVPPGLHGQDVGYTYFDPTARSNESDDSLLYRLFGLVNETLALVLQDYITSFAASGVPESAVDGLAKVDVYGRNESVVRLDKGGIEEVRDPAANERCRWWMLGLYY
ncbi:Carboxylesterase type B [Lasiodiplodia theobromae]|nr:Carboxylesterase type B [Lasiodiplodia theobromae]